MTACVLGIDPGASGALAFLYTATPERVATVDMPIGAVLLAEQIKKFDPDVAYVEAVGARPGQGVSSCFAFGRSFGEVIGVLGALAVPVHFVAPSKWKKFYGLSKDKEDSRRKALEFWPVCAEQFKRKRDHNRSEAALIARYACAHELPASGIYANA